jgi:quercetin dioxygenase-like cupin family protein
MRQVMNVYREDIIISMLYRSQMQPDSMVLQGGRVHVLVSGADTEGRFALAHIRVIKGCEPPRHIHTYEDEIVYVLDGSVEFCVGETRRDILAGRAIVLPRGIEHSFRLHSDQADLLLMLMPIDTEGFIEQLPQAASGLTQPHFPALSASIEQLVTLAARYGVEITGPA